jgi:hypothetical protein
MVPPNDKGLKRLSAMLWAYVLNNNVLDPLAQSSNVHYSPWSRNCLAQKVSAGGLNAQNYEFHLTAIHTRWIFKLLDPRHIVSWKPLPFHFLENAIPGLGDSIFLADPTIISTLNSLPSRWLSYLTGWFSSGLRIAAPPADFDCILNESIWFNRFLYFKTDSKHGRLLNKDTEERLIKRAYTHLSDLLAFMPPTEAGASPWLTKEDAIFLTCSPSLGAAIYSLIDLVRHEWSRIVRLKVREPFSENEWVIKRSELQSPLDVYSVCHVLPKKLIGVRFIVMHDGTLHDTKLKVNLSKSHVVKACVLDTSTSAPNSAPILKYCGNYATSKLLLSRLSWLVDDTIIDFTNFAVKSVYRAMLSEHTEPIPAIQKWVSKLGLPTSRIWKHMVAYLRPYLEQQNKRKII